MEYGLIIPRQPFKPGLRATQPAHHLKVRDRSSPTLLVVFGGASRHVRVATVKSPDRCPHPDTVTQSPRAPAIFLLRQWPSPFDVMALTSNCGRPQPESVSVCCAGISMCSHKRRWGSIHGTIARYHSARSGQGQPAFINSLLVKNLANIWASHETHTLRSLTYWDA